MSIPEIKYKQLKCTKCNKVRLSTWYYDHDEEHEWTCYECQGVLSKP